MKHLKAISTLLVAASAYLLPAGHLSANIVENTIVSQDGSGNAMSTWDLIDTTTNIRTIQVSTQAAGSGTRTTPITISNTSFDSYTPLLAVNANGDAVAVWSLIDPLFQIVSVAGAIYTSATNTWSDPTILSSSNENINVPESLQINANGNFCVVWDSNLISSGLTVARGVLGTVSGGWGPTTDMSAEQ